MSKEKDTAVATAVATPATKETKPTYKVVGLQESEYMPVEVKGKVFNLAEISATEAEYLYKAGCPFLVQV